MKWVDFMFKKAVIVFLFLLILVSYFSPLYTHASDSIYEGNWVCINSALNKPEKNISRLITKVSDVEYHSKLQSPYKTMTQVFILKGDLLIQKDAPESGLMIQDGKLQTIDVVNGVPTKPQLGQIICDRAAENTSH